MDTKHTMHRVWIVLKYSCSTQHTLVILSIMLTTTTSRDNSTRIILLLE